MDIASKTKTIQACFRECLYDVPNFQRPYSWEEEQLEDYWNDVVLANGDFFFGTTVTWVSTERSLFSNTYSLIDGQQRLTTSAVALSVIRDFFSILDKSLGNSTAELELKSTIHEQKDTTQRYLIVKDDDSVEHPVITRPEPMFWEVVQKPGSIPSGVTWSASAKLVGKARKYFEDKVTSEIDTAADTPQKIDRLRELRNNILQARVIQVELSSEEDAFLIFETLNTRGADLRLADLVKNMLVRGVSSDPHDREAVATRWQKIFDDVTNFGDNPDSINRFIWQSWNSRRDAVKEPELYKKLKTLIAGGSLSNEAYLAELETDANIYMHFEYPKSNFPERPASGRQGLALAEVQDSIRALAIFNVSVANSAVMALVRKYNETNTISERQLKRAIIAIENFHFQFSAMANSGSTGGTRGRYNRFSVVLMEANTKPKVRDAIDDFVSRLSGSLPSKVVVETSFKRLAYAPKIKLTAATRTRGSRDLIRYVLLTIANRLGNLPSPQHGSDWTIEHLVPQSSATASFDHPAFSIGNLALLSGMVNSDLGDKKFQVKKAQIVSSGFPKDAKLTDWLTRDSSFEPSVSDIEDRAKNLAELARSTIWAVA